MTSPAPVLGGVDPKLPGGSSRRWRSVAEVTLFMFILLTALGLGVLYVDPELRMQATAWVNKMLGSAKGEAPARSPAPSADRPAIATPLRATTKAPDAPPANRLPAPPSKLIPMPAETKLPPVPEAKPAPPPEPKHVATPDVKKVPVPEPERVSAPKPKPAPVRAADVPVKPSPESSEPPKPAVIQTPAPPEPKPRDSIPPSPAPGPSDDEAVAKERGLYRAALDAEGRGDFAEAVRHYEEIRKLPRSVWHTDVESRLNYDKALLGK